MTLLAIIAAVTLVSSAAAMSLRNLVHCALSLAVALSGLAVMYLQLGAQFVGFAQVLIYVGAVAILIVFAILLTRGSELQAGPGGSAPGQPGQEELEVPTPAAEAPRTRKGRRRLLPGWVWGPATALAVFAVIAGIVLRSEELARPAVPTSPVTVRRIGEELMSRYVLPLEVLGVLLTAAMIGAVILALREPEPPESSG